MIVMNGFNRCGGRVRPVMVPMAQPQMMYPMSAVPQMPVKTEMVKGADMKENACEPTMAMMPQPMMSVPMGQYETCCQVVEPTVCCVPEVHHHHRVEHVVPVVVKTVHHHHNHHDYVICKQEATECHQYDHGLRNEDWCSLAMAPQCPPRPMCKNLK